MNLKKILQSQSFPKVMTRTKRGDVRSQTFQASADPIIPSYTHANTICYDENLNTHMEVKHGKTIGSR